MDTKSPTRRSSNTPEGVEIRTGSRGERLRVTFYWLGVRRRETLDIPATPANIKYAGRLRAEVLNSIERGTFDYAAYFPNSAIAKRHAPISKKRYTVSNLVDSYIATARRSKSLSPSTIASYARWAESRIKPKWDQTFADALTTPELRAWVADLVSELEPKSVRNCVGLLSAVLNRAAADSVIQSSPLAPIKLKSILPRKQKAGDDNIDPFNDDEIASILSACRSIEERSLWQFAFASGLRTGELIAIKWGHIDWQRSMIRVEDNIVMAEGCSVEKDTKTGNVRDVPILPAARDALEAMKPVSRMASSYIFIHPVTHQRWSNDHQLRTSYWKPTLLRAGVRYRIPYQTRHTFASRLLMAGEPELLVAKLLGHATVEMVRRHYGRYIAQPEGITLRGDYSKFGADLGQHNQHKATLTGVNQKNRTA